MKVYRDRRVIIPLCKGIIRCKEKGMIKYRLPLGFNNKVVNAETPCIGYMCEDNPNQMYPNDNYRLIFPSAWEDQFKERPTPALKKIGMYAAVKAIDQNTTVKTLLGDSFGEPKANALIDYAMYSILYHTNVADHYSNDMKNYLLFSDIPYSDSYYSDLFKKGMPWQEITSYTIGWVNWCKNNGVQDIYICIDGSNEDCDSKGVTFAEKGHNKSNKNKNIIGFTYAVTAEGMPVAYKVYRGGLIDAKAMKKILGFFKELEFKVKGVIIDRGYCYADTFDYLREQNIAYVVMVKGKPDGFTMMYSECGKHLHSGDNFVEGTELYAIQNKVKLFKKSSYEDFLTIFFDHVNASGQETALMKKINKEIKRIDRLLAQGKEPTVKSELENLIYIDKTQQDNGITTGKARINPLEYDEELSEKGIYSILTSEELPAYEVDRLYNCRDSSEKTYSIIKTQLGYGTMRIHCTLGVQSRFFLAFLCSIIRYFIETTSLSIGVGTNQMIDELKKIEIERINKQYNYEDADHGRIKSFFGKLGVPDDFLIEITKETNNRVMNVKPQVRKRKPGPKKGSHHVQLDKSGFIVKKKPGPKPGSKKTETNKDGSLRKKPGPKPGFKRGELKADGSPRQKPGPKPGSKNKLKV